ncbi:hypothetical protein FA10DRAFT_267683 [Acaromyces ingoldii]|uniref:DUF985 domain-containing protein n=1 Tax=Acaromyces ingoldii TaxID=215250 RepID=A0A316YKC3_9BASI|nr:hypothetical protein FA10DRAFT_267683 [Acaromyces ingoldii]PWN89078.1 hypothetical protein FA10DRAFT_267683 [Acaromyces ingoldii]
MYSYSTPSSEIIETLKLIPHPEGGHFAVTYVDEGKVASPYASNKEERVVQSTIYYLLSVGHNVPDNGKEPPERLVGHSSALGKLHKNKSPTMHLHHSGRAIYTLIEASPKPGKAPEVKQVVMGEDVSKGETRQLMVDGNWWKVSEIPKEDLEAVEKGQVDPERVGCLISEVVAPGFDWNDHTWLDQKSLAGVFGDDKASIARFTPYVHP